VLLVFRVEIPVVIDMPLLSTFLQFRVCDDSGRRYDLDDIAIALLESDYPAVTHFVYKNSERQHMVLPRHAVTGLHWPHSRIRVKNFDAAQPVTTFMFATQKLSNKSMKACDKGFGRRLWLNVDLSL
jgi:hypothetical protein